MSSMLKDILEAEKKAREFNEQAEKLKAETIAAVEKEKQQIIAERLKEAEEEVKRIRNSHQKAVDESLRNITASSSGAEEKLRKTAEENSELWINKIVAGVLRG